MQKVYVRALQRMAAMAATVLAAGYVGVASAEPGVTPTAIRLGQSGPLTGPLAELGHEFITGIRAHFKALNELGGVHGRRVEFIPKDDGYVVDRTLANARLLLDEEGGVFAFLGMVGTANNLALLPLIEQSGVPSVAPYTGADGLRKHHQLVFHLRASYGNEAEKIVHQLVTVGITKIAAFYQDDAFGQAALAGVEAALESLREHDLGGIRVHYSPTQHAGSQYVDLTIVSRSGKLLK